MTYDASTSLGIHISNLNSSQKAALSSLMDAIKKGLNIPESSFVFSINPLGNYERKVKAGGLLTHSLSVDSVMGIGFERGVLVEGDVFEVRATSLDLSMWKLGGAAIPLGLIEHAKVSFVF